MHYDIFNSLLILLCKDIEEKREKKTNGKSSPHIWIVTASGAEDESA